MNDDDIKREMESIKNDIRNEADRRRTKTDNIDNEIKQLNNVVTGLKIANATLGTTNDMYINGIKKAVLIGVRIVVALAVMAIGVAFKDEIVNLTTKDEIVNLTTKDEIVNLTTNTIGE